MGLGQPGYCSHDPRLQLTPHKKAAYPWIGLCVVVAVHVFFSLFERFLPSDVDRLPDRLSAREARQPSFDQIKIVSNHYTKTFICDMRQITFLKTLYPHAS